MYFWITWDVLLILNVLYFNLYRNNDRWPVRKLRKPTQIPNDQKYFMWQGSTTISWNTNIPTIILVILLLSASLYKYILFYIGAVKSKLGWQWFITKYNGNIVFQRKEFGGLSLQRVVLSTRGVVRVHVTLFIPINNNNIIHRIYRYP